MDLEYITRNYVGIAISFTGDPEKNAIRISPKRLLKSKIHGKAVKKEKLRNGDYIFWFLTKDNKVLHVRCFA